MFKKYVRKRGLSLFLGTVPFLLFLIFCFVAFAKAEQELVGWWKFNKDSGDVLNDSSGNGNDGKIQGATWVKSEERSALLFDGVDDYVDCGNSVSVQLDTSLTITTWVNIQEISAKDEVDKRYIFAKHDWNIGIGSSNIPFFETWDGYGMKRVNMSADKGIPVNKWVNIVVVYSVEKEVMEFYINGEIAGYQKRSDGMIGGNNRFVLLFGREPLALKNFKGLISETKLYSRALSLEEIKSNYQGIEIKSNNAQKIQNVKKFTGWPKEIEKVKWLNSKAGISEEVLAPWTPIEVDKQKSGKELIVKVWGREYEFNNSSFPTRIVTKGNSILAKPIRIIARVDGKNVIWQWNSPKIEKQKPGVLKFTQSVSGEGLVLSAVTHIEYDGMIRCDWKVTPQRALKLEELTFEIPMYAKYAKYIYTPGYYTKVGFIPKDGWNTWFIPMIWLGNEELGLEWFCESDKDWYNAKSNQSIEVVPQGDLQMLRLHIIDRPIHMEPGVRVNHDSGIPIMQPVDEVNELDYTFGLQATPVKPIEKDVWDYKIVHVGQGGFDIPTTVGSADRFNIPESTLDSLVKAGAKTIAFHEHWTDIHSGIITTYDKDLGPVYDEALKKLVKNCHTRGMQILLYFGFLISDLEPEYALFNEECVIIPKNIWDCNWPPQPVQKAPHVCWRSVWQDYVIDGLDRIMMKEYDIDGVYMDSTSIMWGGCKNTLHGCGYIWLDGKVRRTFSIFPNRQIMKRIYTVVKKHKPEGQTNLHNSLEMLVPAIAWTTGYWNGEHLGIPMYLVGVSKKDPILKKLPLDYFRTEFMGHQWGVAAEFLEYKFTDDPNEALALTLIHDVPVRIWYAISPVWKLMDEFGRKESEWLPYWKNKEYVTVTPDDIDVYVSLYKHPKNGVLAVVSNLGEKEAKIKVELNLKKLQLKGKLSVYNVLADDGTRIDNPIGIMDDTFELVLDSENFKIIWVKEIKEM